MGIDTLIKEIKKHGYNAESVLLSSPIFANIKESQPNVDSSEQEQDQPESGIDVINSPLNTSSVGGADLLDIDDDSHSDSDSSTSSSPDDLLSLGGGKDDDSSSSEKNKNEDDNEDDNNEDDDNKEEESELDLDNDENENITDTDNLLDLDDMSTDVEYSNEKKR